MEELSNEQRELTETEREYLKWIVPSMKSKSVRCDEDCIRVKKAEEQSKMNKVSVKKTVEYVNEFLKSIGMQTIDNPRVEVKKTKIRRIDYYKIQKDNELEDKNDIVWIKFTEDEYIGVVGTSCDIFFNKLEPEIDYKSPIYSTSDIILHRLNKKWNENFVLIFPLINIPKGLNRSDIESGIGNYLIHNNVPILDFYSHNY